MTPHLKYIPIIPVFLQLFAFLSTQGQLSSIQSPFGLSLLNPIKNYGCWCRFEGNDLLKGYGQPIDWIDELCKEYTNCLRCPSLNLLDERGNSCAYDDGSLGKSVKECTSNNMKLDHLSH